MTRPRWKKIEPDWLHLDPECVFCHRDPYEYVDIGVGYQPVAVSCCEYGISLYQYRDPQLGRIADLLQGDKRRAVRGNRLWSRYQEAEAAAQVAEEAGEEEM